MDIPVWSFLKEHLGKKADTASSTGSALARLTYIISTLFPTVQKPRTTARVSYATTSETYVTALTVSGKGALKGMCVHASSATTIANYRITIDGTTELGTSATITSNTDRYFATGAILTDDSGGFSSASGDSSVLDIQFKASLLIEVFRVSGSGQITTTMTYEVE